jgi:hypothetical protein
MIDPTCDEIVGILQEHEEAMATLYAAFREHLPEWAPFWNRLVSEEHAHAIMLSMLREHLEKGGVHLNPRKFTLPVVRASINYLQQETAKVKAEGCSPLRALGLALSFERALIEDQFFAVFESDTREMATEFEELREHTLVHRKLLEDAINTEKQRPE